MQGSSPTNNMVKIMFYQMNQGQGDVAEFGTYSEVSCQQGDCDKILKKWVKRDRIPRPITPRPCFPGRDPSKWDITGLKGENIYVIRLSSNTNAYFEKNKPVLCLAEHFQPFINCIKDIKIHADNWVSFMVDWEVIDACDDIKKTRKQPYATFLNVPLYLNLIDRSYNIPVWITANHPHGHHHSHGRHDDHGHPHFDNESDYNLRTHGGIHPPSASTSFVVFL